MRQACTLCSGPALTLEFGTTCLHCHRPLVACMTCSDALPKAVRKEAVMIRLAEVHGCEVQR